MDHADLAFLPATDLLAMLDKHDVSSRELLDCYMERVERFNPTINAIVTRDYEHARERAAAADEARARGETWGPLHGLPITVKDVFETAGLRTTAGAPDLAEHVPSKDAVLVRRLRNAGAVIFAKTNTPTYARDGQTFNPLFGTTNNPWDLSRTPGGSSGGCASALATGLTSLSFGSDIAGSIRIPAAYCGLFGHKPTFGLIPTRGHIPGPPGQLHEVDINVVGPLARDARDLDLALSVLAGPITQEALGWRFEPPPPRRESLRDYRVAVWSDDPFCSVDAAVKKPMDDAVAALRSAGVGVEEARPDVPLADSHSLFMKLLLGDPQRTHEAWMSLDEERQRYRNAWAVFFERYDVLLCPIGPVMAQPHNQSPLFERRITVNGKERSYGDVLVWTGLIGVSYLPSTAVPAGRTPEGLPVGFQVVGPHLADRSTIDFAARLGELTGGFARPPGF